MRQGDREEATTDQTGGNYKIQPVKPNLINPAAVLGGRGICTRSTGSKCTQLPKKTLGCFPCRPACFFFLFARNNPQLREKQFSKEEFWSVCARLYQRTWDCSQLQPKPLLEEMRLGALVPMGFLLFPELKNTMWGGGRQEVIVVFSDADQANPRQKIPPALPSHLITVYKASRSFPCLPSLLHCWRKKTSRETSSLDHKSPLLSIKQWAAHLELATPENEGRILKLTLCLCLSILTDANASFLLIGKQCFSALVLKTVLFLWPTLLIKFCEFQQPRRRQLLQKIDGKLFAFSKER